jgi:hypothetical protein
MDPLRKELQAYASACERLLSSHLHPALTQEEKDLIVYYADELAHKYNPEHTTQSRYARA